MELLDITETGVLKCAEVVIELLVTGTKTVVLVELRREVGMIINEVAVLFAIMEVAGTEVLLGTTLLETFMANDDEVIARLDAVSGVAVGVQDDADTEIVMVLSYKEVTSLDKV